MGVHLYAGSCFLLAAFTIFSIFHSFFLLLCCLHIDASAVSSLLNASYVFFSLVIFFSSVTYTWYLLLSSISLLKFSLC